MCVCVWVHKNHLSLNPWQETHMLARGSGDVRYFSFFLNGVTTFFFISFVRSELSLSSRLCLMRYGKPRADSWRRSCRFYRFSFRHMQINWVCSRYKTLSVCDNCTWVLNGLRGPDMARYCFFYTCGLVFLDSRWYVDAVRRLLLHQQVRPL